MVPQLRVETMSNKSPLNCRTIQPPRPGNYFVDAYVQEGDIEWRCAWFERILASLELMEKLGIPHKKMPWK